MDVVSAFRSEVLRPLITLVVPGAVVAAPAAFAISVYWPQSLEFASAHPSVAAWGLGLGVLFLGVALEDVGSVIEANWIDPKLRKERPEFDAEWEAYLALRLRDELIGQRYLRSKLTQLKFELSIAEAFALAWLLLSFAQLRSCVLGPWEFVCVTVLLFAVALGFWRLANMTAALLARTRKIVIHALMDSSVGLSSIDARQPTAPE